MMLISLISDAKDYKLCPRRKKIVNIEWVAAGFIICFTYFTDSTRLGWKFTFRDPSFYFINTWTYLLPPPERSQTRTTFLQRR